MIIYLYKQPDILVSSSGKLTAIRQDSGIWAVSSRVHDRFTAGVWARQSGADPDNLVRWIDGEASRCDEYGCYTAVKGYSVAVSDHAAAHAEDCARADIMISSAPLRRRDCRAAIQVGFFDLYYNGAHALWLPDDRRGTIKVESVASTRGTRPWTVSNRR